MLKSIKNSSKDYLEQIRDLTKDYNSYEIIGEDYYEWAIDDCSILFSKQSPEFTLCGKKWKMVFHENSYSSKVRLTLKLIDNNDNQNIFAKILISFKNDFFYSVKTSPFYHFNMYNKYKYDIIYSKEELNKEILKPLVKDNKISIGVYIRIYNYSLYEYICELKNIVNDNNREIINEDYFECPIQYWSKVGSLFISPEIEINNSKWKFKFFINNIKSALVFDLETPSFKISDFGYVYVNYVVSLHKINDFSYYYAKEFTTLQRNHKNSNEFTFNNPSDFGNIKYLIENGNVIVGLYICIYRNNFKGPSLSPEGKQKLAKPNTQLKRYNSEKISMRHKSYADISLHQMSFSSSEDNLENTSFSINKNDSMIEGKNNGNSNKQMSVPPRTSSIRRKKSTVRSRSVSLSKQSTSPLSLNTPKSEHISITSLSDSFSSSQSSSPNSLNGDVAVVLFNFKERNSSELSLIKGEQIIVIDWNGDNEWAFGCTVNNPQKQGLILKSYITKYNSVKVTALPSPPYYEPHMDSEAYQYEYNEHPSLLTNYQYNEPYSVHQHDSFSE